MKGGIFGFLLTGILSLHTIPIRGAVESLFLPQSEDIRSIQTLTTPTFQDALILRISKAVRESGVLSALPKGVTVSFESEGEKEGAWYPLAMREVHGPGSGADPAVSPVLAHFYIHESSGEIQWYDPVTDERRPFADFVKSWKE